METTEQCAEEQTTIELFCKEEEEERKENNKKVNFAYAYNRIV